jgi:hypothetical protein
MINFSGSKAELMVDHSQHLATLGATINGVGRRCRRFILLLIGFTGTSLRMLTERNEGWLVGYRSSQELSLSATISWLFMDVGTCR